MKSPAHAVLFAVLAGVSPGFADDFGDAKVKVDKFKPSPAPALPSAIAAGEVPPACREGEIRVRKEGKWSCQADPCAKSQIMARGESGSECVDPSEDLVRKVYDKMVSGNALLYGHGLKLTYQGTGAEAMIAVETERRCEAWEKPDCRDRISNELLVTKGLLERFVRTEDELAAAIGHELTHVYRESPKRLRRIKKGLAAKYPNSVLERRTREIRAERDHENEADCYGALDAAIAGYDPLAAEIYLVRAGKIEPKLENPDPTSGYDPNSERARLLRACIERGGPSAPGPEAP